MDIEDKKFIFNDSVFDFSEFNIFYRKSVFNVYEVIRIVDYNVLFWDEHFKRLKESVYKLVGKKFDFADLFDKILKLIKINNINIGNIKIEIIFEDNEIKDIYLYEMKFYYPNREEIEKGVKVSTFFVERKNPTVKTYDHEFKEKIGLIISINDVYEVLLIDSNGYITEGSRTNIYFVKGSKFFTAEKDCVLNGVTRIKVNNIILRNGFNLCEEKVLLNDIGSFDACFLTSTSSNILPIRFINNCRFYSSDNVYVRELIKLFEKELKSSLE